MTFSCPFLCLFVAKWLPDFDITREQSQALFKNGEEAARTFLIHWDFDEWKNRYRQSVQIG
ncbi:MAG: hypothetical protein A3G93_08650 [Nitrospinae bacterium RIFCSPLOWO2_12_FULL_45_22]|nr:MAG: hypothetical protein A3G93_08650 [Nitrospinae bacterium RIFCSPLOWO2_12_FULL_45_22]